MTGAVDIMKNVKRLKRNVPRRTYDRWMKEVFKWYPKECKCVQVKLQGKLVDELKKYV